MVANYGVDSLAGFQDLANMAVLQGAGLGDPALLQQDSLMQLYHLQQLQLQLAMVAGGGSLGGLFFPQLFP